MLSLIFSIRLVSHFLVAVINLYGMKRGRQMPVKTMVLVPLLFLSLLFVSYALSSSSQSFPALLVNPVTLCLNGLYCRLLSTGSRVLSRSRKHFNLMS